MVSYMAFVLSLLLMSSFLHAFTRLCGLATSLMIRTLSFYLFIIYLFIYLFYFLFLFYFYFLFFIFFFYLFIFFILFFF